MNKKSKENFELLGGYNSRMGSLALSIVLCGGVFKVYFMPLPIFLFMTLLAAVICILMFAGGDKLIEKGFTGKLFIALFVIADIYIFSHVSAGGVFRENFFFAGEASGTNPRFLLGLILSVPVFFGITVYYFGCINYRMGYLMLVSLMSCVLYVKNVQEVDNLFVALFLLFNFIIYAGHRAGEENKRLYFGKKGGQATSLVTFLCILILGVSLIPKDNEAKYYDKFRRLFMNYNISSPLGEDYSNLSAISGNADNYENLKNRRMYTLWSDKAIYLKKQNFDYYDFDKDVWYADEEYSKADWSVTRWRNSHQWLNLTALQTAMKKTAEYDPEFAKKYHLENIINGSTVKDRVKNIYIQPHNFAAAYYLVPSRCVMVVQREGEPEPTASQNGAFTAKEGMHGRNAAYQVTCYDDAEPKEQWTAMGGADFDFESSDEMLYCIYSVLTENDEDFSLGYVAYSFAYENYNAQIYNADCEENNRLISSEIKGLAEEITKSCTYDYEKAEALQNYFHDNGYVYDMEYIAEDTSPEYFLFESKRGTCSDFASAYVLMARSVGLTVRYAEGFAPEKTPVQGAFAVTDITAHAFPEVFIHNLGWVVYEPTVASPYNSFGSSGINFNFGKIKVDLPMVGTVGALVLCIILFNLFARVIIPFAEEKLFLIRVNKSEASKGVVMLHKRLAEKNVWSLIGNGKSLTPYEMAEKIKALTGFETHNMAFLTEKVSYEGLKASSDDMKEAVMLYRALEKLAKKQKRKNGYAQEKNA